MTKPEWKIIYHPTAIEDVMRHFIKGFQPENGEVTGADWYYDPAKGVVIFKLIIAPKTPTEEDPP